LALGRADHRDRDGIVDLLSDFPKIDYRDRPTAERLLWQHWPDDPTLIDMALGALSPGNDWHDQWDAYSAAYYLIHCSPTNPTLSNWVRHELDSENWPLFLRDDPWGGAIAFAIEHPDIRASIIARVRSEFGSGQLPDLQSLIVKLGVATSCEIT